MVDREGFEPPTPGFSVPVLTSCRAISPRGRISLGNSNSWLSVSADLDAEGSSWRWSLSLVQSRVTRWLRDSSCGAGFGAGSASNWGIIGHGTAPVGPRLTADCVVVHRAREQ